MEKVLTKEKEKEKALLKEKEKQKSLAKQKQQAREGSFQPRSLLLRDISVTKGECSSAIAFKHTGSETIGIKTVP